MDPRIKAIYDLILNPKCIKSVSFKDGSGGNFIGAWDLEVYNLLMEIWKDEYDYGFADRTEMVNNIVDSLREEAEHD